MAEFKQSDPFLNRNKFKKKERINFERTWYLIWIDPKFCKVQIFKSYLSDNVLVFSLNWIPIYKRQNWPTEIELIYGELKFKLHISLFWSNLNILTVHFFHLLSWLIQHIFYLINKINRKLKLFYFYFYYSHNFELKRIILRIFLLRRRNDSKGNEYSSQTIIFSLNSIVCFFSKNYQFLEKTIFFENELLFKNF